MLTLPDSWTWDFWVADTGTEYHLFFLRASRALQDPDRRHRRASVGHAVSTDLHSWTLLPDALVHADSPAFDDLATWTGSVVQRPDGSWAMLYTGVSTADDGTVQRIGLATSPDLVTWHRPSTQALMSADPRWYEQLSDGVWHDEAWRDPWVFADPDGHGWHMLVTTRSRTGPVAERGVVGHATSPDLLSWQVQPPLSAPGSGFWHLEVLQVALVDGRAVLVFSCLAHELGIERAAGGGTGGIWAVAADGVLGPFDVRRAVQLTDDSLYAGRLVRDRDGRWVLLAFRHSGPEGEFVGGLSDPIPVGWDGDRLVLTTGRR